MTEPLTTEEAIAINNQLEFGSFVEGKSIEEFMQWVYKQYGVSPEEAAAIDAAMRDESMGVCVYIKLK